MLKVKINKLKDKFKEFNKLINDDSFYLTFSSGLDSDVDTKDNDINEDEMYPL